MKFAVANNCGVSVEEQDGHYFIKITKGLSDAVQPAGKTVGDTTACPVILLPRQYAGEGSEELGAVLMKSFLYSLLESEPMPKTLLFLNSGVL